MLSVCRYGLCMGRNYSLQKIMEHDTYELRLRAIVEIIPNAELCCIPIIFIVQNVSVFLLIKFEVIICLNLKGFYRSSL